MAYFVNLYVWDFFVWPLVYQQLTVLITYNDGCQQNIPRPCGANVYKLRLSPGSLLRF